ncbi:hypothetical protein [Polaromonas sp.]|uniref:hypothetical protein n=1 Tax=Polaromonas sp. TaxID=1869339 RepID=UPI003263349E
MIEAISRLLGLKTAASKGKADKPSAARSSARTPPADNRDGQHTIEDNSDNGMRRQLVQTLLRECLRRNGIVPGWIECQMLVVNSRSRGPGMYARLILRRWDPRLLTYAYAFQKELLAAISQFEPQSSTWLHGVSWEFNVGDSCPYPDMPDPAVWREPPAAAVPVAAAVALAGAAPAVAAPAAGAEDEVLRDLKDLQSMFAARDASMEEKAASGAQADFQPTEPSSLG